MKIYKRYFDILGEAATLKLLEPVQLCIAGKVRKSTIAVETQDSEIQLFRCFRKIFLPDRFFSLKINLENRFIQLLNLKSEK